jgi:hypothetical protein
MVGLCSFVRGFAISKNSSMQPVGSTVPSIESYCMTPFSVGVVLGGKRGGFGKQGALPQGFGAVAVEEICHYEGPPPPF